MRSWWDYPGVLKWSGFRIGDKVISRLHKAGCWDLNSCWVALHDEGWTCVEFTGHGSSLNWISATASSTCRIKVTLRRMRTSFFPVNSLIDNLLWPQSYIKKKTVGYIILASCPCGPTTAHGVAWLGDGALSAHGWIWGISLIQRQLITIKGNPGIQTSWLGCSVIYSDGQKKHIEHIARKISIL